MFECFWEKQVNLGWFAGLASFRAKSHEIHKHFLAILMENNNKMTKNVVKRVQVQNLVILGWFPTSTGFRVKSHEFLNGTF